MSGASSDWQTWAALVVVFITAAAFVARSIRRGKKRKVGCGHDCGCGKK